MSSTWTSRSGLFQLHFRSPLLCSLLIAGSCPLVLQDSVTAFQTSFFSFLSLVFAIYSGNTMAFLYDVSIYLLLRGGCSATRNKC